ncbi:MAG: flagellar transcriptional regulator FlhD [Betaproteobacteria bacterium]|nr:flagellar transcriptional regulator FlhD [Betaproteobacteria bacterium]
MNNAELRNELHELNLTYLMIAQQMLRADRDAALYRLGVGQEFADVLERLTPAQILKMAASEMLMFRLRFDERALLGLLASHANPRSMPQSHAAILMTGQPAEAMA